MILPDFILRLIGRKIAIKIDLKENSQMETKPWYKSITIWSAVVAALLGVYGAVSSVHPLPPIPDWILKLLGATGLYGLRTADTKIG